MLTNIQTRRSIFAAAILILSLSAGFVIFYATPRGPWVFSDSVGYLDAARNFAEGRGFVLSRLNDHYVPMYLRPPFYSLVLGLMVMAEIDPITGTRWLNIILFATLIMIISISAFKFSKNGWLTFLLSIFLITDTDLVSAYTGMMTEPIFILFSLAQIVLLIVYFQRADQTALVSAIILTSLLLMTRFAGIANLAILGLSMLIFCRRRFQDRIKLAFFSGLISVLPFGIWTIYLRTSGSAPGVYDFDIGNLGMATWPVRVAFFEYTWQWLPFHKFPVEPAYIATFVTLFFAAIFLATVRVLWLNIRSGEQSILRHPTFQFGSLLLAFALVHFLVIAVTYVVVKVPKPALNSRVLLPTKFGMLLGLGILFYGLGSYVFNHRRMVLIPAAFLVPLVLFQIPQTMQTVDNLKVEGVGYTNKYWHNLMIVEALKTVPENVPIISNDDVAVLFFVHRPAYLLPELIDHQPAEKLAQFGQRSDNPAETVFRENGAALVLFFNTHSQLSRIYVNDVTLRLRTLIEGLSVYYEGTDGGIYFYPEADR